MEPIVLATGNPHKVAELRAIFAEARVPVLGLRDLPGWESLAEPAETGATFEENATIKAVSYAGQTGLPCLADDSGLEVDALGGRPGVISSHYSTEGVETGLPRDERDRLNNERLLADLAGVPHDCRTARFVCVMAFCPGGGAFQAPGLVADELLIDRWKTARQLTKRDSDPLPHWELGGSTYSITFRAFRVLAESERDIALKALLFWHGSRVRVRLAVVMPDHVHLLVTPIKQADGSWPSVPWLMQSVKGFSAREINKHGGGSGSVWQDEYFDRIIRTFQHYEELVEYVAMNPVRAGLVKQWLDYRFMGGEVVERRRTRGLKGPAPDTTRGLKGPAPGVRITRGAFEGRIGLPGEVPRGDMGFGYDPLFLVAPGFTCTSAELPPAEKNRLSHRGLAARAMARLLAGT